jgi:hypothetical protein
MRTAAVLLSMLLWTRGEEGRSVALTPNQFDSLDVRLRFQGREFFGRGESLGLAFARAKWRFDGWETWDREWWAAAW